MRFRRLQFSLRYLLVAMVAFSFLFAWLAARMSEGRRHEQLQVAFFSAGCVAKMSHREFVSLRSTLPWIVEFLDCAPAFRRIVYVGLSSTADVDATRALLREVGAVDVLSFSNTPLSDTQLSAMLDGVRVRSLFIQSARLPRTRMAWLDHDGLTWLCVARTDFSNPAIDDLPLTLEYFDATRTRINDEGLDSFLRLKNLRTLKLLRTPTSENEVENLRIKMPWCEIHWEPLLNR